MHGDWEVAYRSAMLETDNDKLAAKVNAATSVLQTRLSELNSAREYMSERERIQSALRTLDAVRRLELRPSA